MPKTISCPSSDPSSLRTIPHAGASEGAATAAEASVQRGVRDGEGWPVTGLGQPPLEYPAPAGSRTLPRLGDTLAPVTS